MTPSMSTNDIQSALEKRFDPGTGWALFWEMSPAGYAKRRADLMAFCVWPSRGLDIHGIEIKASRSDWLAELKKPEKAEESVLSYCDYWWVAAGNPDIVQEGELPSTWGLLIPRGKGLVAKEKAPKLAPKPVDRRLVARLLHRAKTGPAWDEMRRKEDDAYRQGMEGAKAEKEAKFHAVNAAKESAESELARVREDVQKVEEALYVQLGSWNNERFLALIKSAKTLQNNQDTIGAVRKEFLQLREKAASLVAWLDRDQEVK